MMEIAATRPTKALVMAHPFKPLPREDVHVGGVAGGSLESVDLGVPPRGRPFAFINRIGWLSIVPGPASGVTRKKVRRKIGQKRKDSYHR